MVLRALIEGEGDGLKNGIIFCNRKRDVDIVSKSLKKHGFDAAAIHGDLDQSVRTRTLNGFRDGDLRLLIASDVAARGLDIPDVSHVFNFDVPIHAEDYVHRIGRTGRAGRAGKAITISVPATAKYLDKVEELVEKQITRMDSPIATAKPKRAEPKQAEPKRAEPKRAEPKRSDPDTSAEPARARKRDQDKSRDAKKEPRRGRGRRDDNVVGMGDHMPEFLTREFRISKPKKTTADNGDNAHAS